jgi:recombinational DNA repair protein (RecF pathway)
MKNWNLRKCVLCGTEDYANLFVLGKDEVDSSNKDPEAVCPECNKTLIAQKKADDLVKEQEKYKNFQETDNEN